MSKPVGNIVNEINLGKGVPTSILYDPKNGYTYVGFASWNYSGIYVIANYTEVSVIPTALPPKIMCYNPQNGDVYVDLGSLISGSLISVIKGTTIVSNISLNGYISTMLYDRLNGILYAYVNSYTNNYTIGEIYAINVSNNTIIGHVSIGNWSSQHMLLNPSNGYIYLSLRNGSIIVLTPNLEIIGAINVNASVYSMLYDPVNGYIYVDGVGSNGVGELVVINPSDNSVIGFIRVFGYDNYLLSKPVLTYNPSNGYVYVIDGNYIGVVSSNNLVAEIPIGSLTFAVTYSPENNYVYVSANGMISVIDPEYDFVISNLTAPNDLMYSLMTYGNGYTYDADYSTNGTTQVIIIGLQSAQKEEGSLIVNVYNYTLGSPVVGGITYGLLINSENQVVEKAYINSYSQLVFTNVIPGQYVVDVYHIPSSGMNITEYWGNITVNVTSLPYTVNFITNAPVVYSLNYTLANGRYNINAVIYNPRNYSNGASSLTVLVYNVLGRLATTVPGVVLGVLYNSSGFKEVVYMNSSGYLNFYNVPPGTYTLEVYHYPNIGLNLTEYWGGMTVNLQPGSNFVTFYRHEPWIYNLQVSSSNREIVVTVTVNGTVTSPTQGEIELWVTNNPSLASPYSPSKVFYVTINPGLNTFNFTYPVSQAGTYYVYAAVLTYISTYTVTDQWNWTATTIYSVPHNTSSILIVTVYNENGTLASSLPGVVYGILVNDQTGQQVAKAFMNSESLLVFNGIPQGNYTLFVYHYPNIGLNFTEFWGIENVSILPAKTVYLNFTRYEPWIYNIQSIGNGFSITINVTVDDPLKAILHGELYIWVTTSPQTANPSEPTIDTSSTSITMRPGLNKFTYYYATTQKGTYYIYAALLIYNGTQLITTDQWNWTAMYELTFVIYSYAPSVSFELYESNNYFRQGQIIASNKISGEGQTITFNLPQGIYEYNLSLNSQGYTIAPSPTGFINLTKNERIYLWVIPTSNSYTVYMIPVGLPNPSQWYVTYQGSYESLIFLPDKGGTIRLSMNSFYYTGVNLVNLNVYSTNPQYYPLLPIVQINATFLFHNEFYNNESYAVPFATAGYAHIVDWNGVQWNPLLNEYSQHNFDYVYNKQILDGFCWGMSSTAILYYLGILPLPSQGASYTSQLYLGPINASEYLEYLTDASLAVAVHEILDPLNNKIIGGFILYPTSVIVSKTINSIDYNKPVILIINFTNQSGNSLYVDSGYHAVVAWGYVNETNGDVVFLVYDPNYPQIVTRAIYNPANGSFIYIDGHPPYSVFMNGQNFSYPGDVGEVVGVASPKPANLLWFDPLLNGLHWFVPLSLNLAIGPLLDYTLIVSTSPLNVYTGGELVGYFVDNKYFVTASTVQPGELAGYVDGAPWPPLYIPLYIVAIRNGFSASVDPNSTLVALRFANASGTIMVYGFEVNTTEHVAVRFVNQSSFIVASQNNTAVKLELFSVTNSSVKTYNTTLSLSNRTGYVVSANYTNLTNTTIKTVTVSWVNITQTQTAAATTTTTNSASTSTSISTGTITTATTTTSSSTSSVTVSTTSSMTNNVKPSHSALPIWVTVAVIVVIALIIALLMARRS
ncbi:hypothetical protein DDW11_05480 [Sulfolobus sp. SCGC AB-777_G06]|nr:hypothetical protein DDW11_05480 [Sulfolobus sp. SCGC AB-777_G06]